MNFMKTERECSNYAFIDFFTLIYKKYIIFIAD